METLFKILLWLMTTVTPKQFEKKKLEWIYYGMNEERTERNNRNKTVDEQYWSGLYGKRVIYFSNEWDNIGVGYLTGMMDGCIPIVYDVISRSTFAVGGKVIPYTSNRLELLATMAPNERWDILMCIQQKATHHNYVIRDAVRKLTPWDIMHWKINATGFTDCTTLEEFKSQESKKENK